MSISTYTELQTAVSNWLGRADLTSRIPEFITLAQARINRQARATVMETKSTSITVNAEYVNVPTDFMEARSFYLTSTTPRLALEYQAADWMTDSYNTSDKPKFYRVVGSQFRFAPTPDQSYTATLVYYAKPATFVTTSQETNSLFPANADLYLYASLLEAESFIMDDPRLPIWKAGYDEALANLNRVSKGYMQGGPMATRVDSSTP